VKVIVDRLAYTPPTRRDHLIKVPRNVLYMSRHDEYRPPTNDDELVEALVNGTVVDGKILTYSGIVCDACSRPIPYPYVWIFVAGGVARGTRCEDCRTRYHNNKPAYVLQKVGACP